MDMKMRHSGKESAVNNSNEIWVLDFTPESAQDFRDRLMDESNLDPNRPLIVYIDSYGGQVDALAKMIATMDEIPNPIITCCMGKAMSCGAILLSHGDLRFADVHSRIMIHKVSGASFGDSEDIANDAAEITRLNKYWLGFLAENCSIEGGYGQLETKLKSKDGRDRYLTAKEAIEFGIIDSIGYPKIIPSTVYDVATVPEKISLIQRAQIRSEYAKALNTKTPKTPKKRIKNVRKRRK